MTAITAERQPRAIVARYLREVVAGAGPGTSEDLVSNEVLRQRLVALQLAFPDLTLMVDQVVAAGDMVALHATASGTHSGTFQGVPPTGRRWQATWTAILRVADGRIADFWDNWDLLSILEQLGAVKRSPGASA